MQKRELTFKSANGTSEIAAYFYRPDGKIKGVVQISHGMCEYLKRYERFIAFLCGEGYFVCGNDHMGHGRSVKNLDELGYFAPEGGYRMFAEDLHTLTGLTKEEVPGVPYFLLGHSMGSFIARDYLTRFGEELDGCLILGTGGDNPALPFGIALASLIKTIRGERYRSTALQKIMSGMFNARIPEHPTGNEWTTRWAEEVERYSGDPLCTFTFTTSGFLDLFRLNRLVSGEKWAKKVPPGLPVILMSGEEDPVGGYGKGVRQVYSQLKKAGLQDVDIRLYPDDRHEILNELDRENVYNDILAFLKNKSRGA